MRWVYRDLPLDRLALLAAQLAHCMPKDRYFAIIDVLFSSQDEWARAADPNAALGQIGRTAGLDQPTIEKCLSDTAARDKIVARLQEGDQRYSLKSTPTFIINGKAESGDMDYDTFYNLVKDLLPKA